MDIQPLHRLQGHRQAIYALCPLDQDRLLSGGAEGWVVQWNLAQPQAPGQVLAKIEGGVLCLHYWPARQLLAIGGLQGEVYWVDLAKGQTLRRWLIHPKGVMDFCMVDEGHLASVGANGCFTLWDIEARRPIESLQLSSLPLRRLCALGEGQFAIGGSDGSIHRLGLSQNRQWQLGQSLQNAHLPSVFALAWDKEAERLWSGGRDAQIAAWSLGEEQPQAQRSPLPPHLFTVNDLMLHPKHPYLFSASRDKTIKCWKNDPSFSLVKVLDAPKYGYHTHSVNRLLCMREGRVLVSGSDDASIGIWQLNPI